MKPSWLIGGVIAVLLVGGLLVAAGCKPQTSAAPQTGSVPGGRAAPAAATAGTVYTCPMHPDVKFDKPGQCPTCGMNLEPAKAPATAAPAEKAEPSATGAAKSAAKPAPPVYTCPMHPEVTSNKAGRCPKCDMNLVPKKG